MGRSGKISLRVRKEFVRLAERKRRSRLRNWVRTCDSQGVEKLSVEGKRFL